MSSTFTENSQEDQDEEEQEETCLLPPHKPFCGRLTSSSLSNAEEFSEPDTYSSGFSEDYKTCHRQTQTEQELLTISSSSDIDNHFQASPRYKTIFTEIFQVLKQAKVSEREPIRPGGWLLGQQVPSQNPSTTQGPNTYLSTQGPKSFSNPEGSAGYNQNTTDRTSKGFPSLVLAGTTKLQVLEESYAAVLRKGIQTS